MKTIRSSLFLVPFAVLFGGCAEMGVPDVPDPLQQLQNDTGQPWSVRWRDEFHTPALLEGKTEPLAATAADAQRTARAFLLRYRNLFRFDSNGDVSVTDAATDELGMTHARFVQQQSGIPVWGADLIAHFDSSGRLIRINGRALPIPPVVTTPRLSADEARVAAALDAKKSGAGATMDEITTRAPHLWLFYHTADDVRLTYRVETSVKGRGEPLALETFVDATDGSIVHRSNQLDHLTGTGIGVLGDRESFEVAARKNQYWLEDATRGGIKIYKATSGTELPGSEIHSDDLNSWDQAGFATGAAVDAHAHLERTFDYYLHEHGRKGWKDDGAGPRATVHFGTHYDNAFFDGTQLVFGDGDERTFSALSGALDVVAHEYTHGVTAATAQLGHEGQPGALNEAVSDIFGCLISDPDGAWAVGRAIYHPQNRSLPLRNIAHPHTSGNPATMGEYSHSAEDQGDIHLNSTIVSHAAYLMSAGDDKHPGLGPTEVAKIWYRAVTHYLTSQADFRDAADATLSAAKDLGADVQLVKRAWIASGVMTE